MMEAEPGGRRPPLEGRLEPLLLEPEVVSTLF